MKQQPDFLLIYHELSHQYGQTMTMKDVCNQLGLKNYAAARQRIPRGWVGEGKGLRMKTLLFAKQFAEL